MAVAQSVHILQHVTFIKHSILQTQLTEKAAVAIVSYGQVIPVIHQTEAKQNKTNILIHFALGVKSCLMVFMALQSPTMIKSSSSTYNGSVRVCLCSRGHNDAEFNIFIEDVVPEVAAVLHRSCIEHQSQNQIYWILTYKDFA